MTKPRLVDLLNDARLRFLAALDEDDTVDLNDSFCFFQILQMAEQTCAISQQEMAEIFGVSRESVNRWVNGNAAPHAYARWGLIEKLCEHIKSKVV